MWSPLCPPQEGMKWDLPHLPFHFLQPIYSLFHLSQLESVFCVLQKLRNIMRHLMLQGTFFSVTLDLHMDSVQPGCTAENFKENPNQHDFYSQKQILEMAARKESLKRACNYLPQAC